MHAGVVVQHERRSDSESRVARGGGPAVTAAAGVTAMRSG